MTDHFSQLGLGFVLEGAELRFRNYMGYRQHMETDAKGKKHWVFYVTGFSSTASGEDGFCHVLKWDGSKDWVSIDKHDRILINGRRYGRTYWNH